jgi:transposase
VLAEGQRVLIADPDRFDGVRVIGVDEHVWRHTRRGDKFVTVIIDLTGIRDRSGPARLLDMVEGRSKQAFKQWLAERTEDWRNGVEVVAMDGFTGFKTASTEELPTAAAVMDPFHVVRLAGDALDQCRRRIQQAVHGHRGRKDDPLYRARRTLHTGADLLTDSQQQRLEKLFADDVHVQVQATWGIYQRMIAAYREPDRTRGRHLMEQVIASVSHGVPGALRELITLGRTLTRRAGDVLAYFDRPTPATARPKRSTADSNTSAAPPSASATSPTTSPDHSWRSAASNPDYTLDHEEPHSPPQPRSRQH